LDKKCIQYFFCSCLWNVSPSFTPRIARSTDPISEFNQKEDREKEWSSVLLCLSVPGGVMGPGGPTVWCGPFSFHPPAAFAAQWHCFIRWSNGKWWEIRNEELKL